MRPTHIRICLAYCLRQTLALRSNGRLWQARNCNCIPGGDKEIDESASHDLERMEAVAKSAPLWQRQIDLGDANCERRRPIKNEEVAAAILIEQSARLSEGCAHAGVVF